MNFALSEFAAACAGEMLGPDCAMNGACIDSRKAGPGILFFALRGSRADGHDFVESALAAGAKAVVSRDGWSTGVIRVESVQKALLDGASALRSRLRIPVVAVTGSSGKTTTREMIRIALSPSFAAASSQGNLNNSLGLPLSILNLPQGAGAAVFELGMNSSGELTILGGVARPDCSVVTNIGSAHIEFFGTRERIAEAKAELLLQTSPSGFCVLPVGEPILEDAASRRGLEVLRAGPGGDVWLEHGESGMLAMPWGLPLRLRVEGGHNFWDALLALTVAWKLGVPAGKAAPALESFAPVGGRGAVISFGSMTILDESYNANPESLAACLEVLAKRSGRRIAVLGDMLELGRRSREMHEDVLRKADSMGLDRLVLVGSRMGEASSVLAGTPFDLAVGWREALALLRAERNRCTVLVKGSHAMQLDLLVSALGPEEKCSTGCSIR